ncbi:MAG: hypothetical protein BGO04_07800 [Microbacterium sp. 70-38]|nr:MAG: hypothetical protein BGO04_07800 [Microbacterium sp. 70-38]
MPNVSHTLPIAAPLKIAAAWTTFMFLYIYVDFFNLYKPGVVDGIRDGLVWRFEVSATLLTFMLASVAIPALVVVLTVTLPARASRVVNIVAASLYIPYSIFNAAGATWEWAFFYGLSIGVEVLLLAFVIRWAWTWRAPADAPVGGTEYSLVAGEGRGEG